MVRNGRRGVLARLSALTIFEPRGEWRRLHRMPPPMRLSRDLLSRGIIYKLQEQAYGGLSLVTTRKLAQASAGPVSREVAKPAPPISLRRARGSCGSGAGSHCPSSMPMGSSGAVSAASSSIVQLRAGLACINDKALPTISGD
jgi:hypothetical protein